MNELFMELDELLIEAEGLGRCPQCRAGQGVVVEGDRLWVVRMHELDCSTVTRPTNLESHLRLLRGGTS